MKRLLDNWHWTIGIPVVLFMLLMGCVSPREQWAVSRSSVTQVERGLVLANQSHVLADKDLVATEPFVIAARGALDQADKELTASGDKPTSLFLFYLNLANSTISNVKEIPKGTP